jgi:hypothetical protein
LATLALASTTGTIVARSHILVSHCSFSTFPLMPGPCSTHEARPPIPGHCAWMGFSLRRVVFH